jgi:hypothetical protein
MAIFCKKSSSASPLRFREPVRADFLGSMSREEYLMPKHEIDPAVFAHIEAGGRAVLRADEATLLNKFRDRSTLDHWTLMRQVLPDAVWENW